MKNLLFIFLVFASFISYSQNTITVSKDSTGDYTTIQEAIDNATFGSVIIVKKGVYNENIQMRDNISLKGENYPKLFGAQNEYATVIMASNCFLSGFDIYNIDTISKISCGISLNNVTKAIIYDNIIDYCNKFGIVIYESDCKLTQNSFLNNKKCGIILGTNVNVDFGYNLLKGNDNGIVFLSETAQGNFYNNDFIKNTNAVYYYNNDENEKPINNELKIDFYNNIFFDNYNAFKRNNYFTQNINYNCFFMNNFDNYFWEKKTIQNLNKTNIFSDPMFVDFNRSDYSLKKNSPCIDAGKNKHNMGLYYFSNGNEPDFFTGNETDATKTNLSKNVKAKYIMQLDGFALNYTANYKSSKVKCIIYSDDLKKFKCIGQYDNKTLFGYFEMNGKLGDVTDNYFNISFDNGTVFLGNDNSGYPADYELNQTISFNVFSEVVYGYYYILKKLPYNLNEQKGEMMFKNIKTNFGLKQISK